MAKCPKCGEVIFHLKLHEDVEVQYDLGATQEGEPNYVQWGVRKRNVIACPRCLTRLFDDDNKAAQWLVGKIEWEPMKDG